MVRLFGTMAFDPDEVEIFCSREHAASGKNELQLKSGKEWYLSDDSAEAYMAFLRERQEGGGSDELAEQR